MVQRLQTIYLLITAILMAVTVFSPLADFIVEGTDKEFTYYTWAFESVVGEIFSQTWGVIVLTVLCVIFPFINIFLFKNRKLQIKIGNITTFLILLLYITIGVYALFIKSENHLIFSNIGYGIILPVIALICNVLAVLQIKKDEKLVQSLNRIR